jgi:hypothetical protein
LALNWQFATSAREPATVTIEGNPLFRPLAGTPSVGRNQGQEMTMSTRTLTPIAGQVLGRAVSEKWLAVVGRSRQAVIA